MKQNSAEHEFRDANWKLVGLRLLVFARYWAKAHYGWCDGRLMPTSKTPEDVACDVYAAYSRGERKFSAEAPMWVQLKSAVKSVLWNLHPDCFSVLKQATLRQKVNYSTPCIVIFAV